MITFEGWNGECYFMPEDGDTARQSFLDMINLPGETYGEAFGFTMVDLVDDIIALDKAGHAQHWYLDHMQEVGHTEHPLVMGLATALSASTISDLTIGTAGCGSHQTRQIAHSKAVVKVVPDGEPWVWWGSVNFSPSGWNQLNIAMKFRSSQFADIFIDQFKRHREWARTNEAAYQLVGSPTEATMGVIHQEVGGTPE